jgi:ribosomal protein S18 acetylase RimI-like enzyme
MDEPARIAWHLRRAESSDAARLAAFAERTFRDTFAATNTAEDMDQYCGLAFGEARQRGEIANPEISTLLVEDGWQIVGYVQFGPGEEPEGLRLRPSWELRRLYVDPALKGSGLARQLMDRVLADAKGGGAASVWLGVWERNPRAIRFYEKTGFRVVGDHTFLLGTDPQRDLIMERVLDP